MKTLKNELLFFGLTFIHACVYSQSMNSTAMSAPSSASNGGNQETYQGITFNSPAESRQLIEYSGSQTIKNVPSVSGPPLTTSNDTCMGSTSGGINGPGFGVSLGSTWADNNCKLLKNSRELWNMGMKAAAMALMCTDISNREALELTGFECPQTAKDKRGIDRVAQVNLLSPATTPLSPPAPIANQVKGMVTSAVTHSVPIISTAVAPILPTATAATSELAEPVPAVRPNAALLIPALPSSKVTDNLVTDVSPTSATVSVSSTVVSTVNAETGSTSAPTAINPIPTVIANTAQLASK